MSSTTSNKHPLPVIHHFFLATYSVLTFLANNIEEVSFSNSFRSLTLSILGSLSIYYLIKTINQNRHRAGLLTSFLLLLFFSYGHVYEYLEGIQFNGLQVGRHRYLLSLWFILFLLGIRWSNRAWASSKTTSHYLNIVSAIALIFPLLKLGSFSIRFLQSKIDTLNSPSQYQYLNATKIQNTPDIYYIILDGYSRDDILSKYYQIDNTPFMNKLIKHGFFIGFCSQSNYAQTQLSLASSLNFNYLDNLGGQFIPQNSSRIGLRDLIRNNSTREILKLIGYKIIAFDSGYEPTRWEDADIYFAPSIVQDINNFEELFIRTTAARVATEGIAFLDIPPDWEKRDQAHRERILFTLDKLGEIPSISGPKFIFAHIISPHWPHVFGPEGEAVHEHNDSITGYRNQVLFINQRILLIIENILKSSPVHPIIILQGDHGSIIESPERRMSILNAYYLPGEHRNLLYEGISPVNTFRVIFNTYFGASYSLLEDTSLYSAYETPFLYSKIYNNRSGCE